jgi:hypothetical protein
MDVLHRSARGLVIVAIAMLPIGCSAGPGQAASAPSAASPSVIQIVGVGPTAAPAPQPFPDDVPLAIGQYILSGDALYGVPPLTISFFVPSDRWVSWGPGLLTNESDTHANVGLSFAGVTNLYADSCRWDSAGAQDPIVGPTVDDLVAALAKLPHVAATAPVDVQLAGHSGRYIELAIDDDIRFPDCDRGEVHFWIEQQGRSRYYQGPGQIEQFWVLDVDGVRLVVEGSLFPGASTANRDELRQVLDSLAIDR